MSEPHVAIVTSRFNQPVTEELYTGAFDTLSKTLPKDNIKAWWVPGAVEIPIVVQRLARLRRFDAIIALGAVVRGETPHFDYVCEQVSQGCQQIMLAEDCPIIFGVLTTDNAEQAYARLGGDKGHKGVEAAETALAMIQLLREIESQ